MEINKDPMAILVGKGGHFLKVKKPGLNFEHCGYKGHLTENYKKIIGYPADFKSMKNGQFGVNKSYFNSANDERYGAIIISHKGII